MNKKLILNGFLLIIILVLLILLIILTSNFYKFKKIEEENAEHFFGGFDSWFAPSAPKNTTALPGTLPNENLNTLEKKISDKMIPSNKFPPSVNLDGNSDDFKDADNLEILGSINGNKVIEKPAKIKNNALNIINSENDDANDDANNGENNAIFSKKNLNSNANLKPDIIKKELKEPPEQSMKSLLNSCQFFNDKCPSSYYPLGNFSIQGTGNTSILTCGNVQNTKPAKAVAQIKNNSIYEIHITDQGHGFNPDSVPNISIEGGKGHGATATAVVDDEGFLKLIKVINPGYNYIETPNILIDAPFMNSSCHLCCKEDTQ